MNSEVPTISPFCLTLLNGEAAPLAIAKEIVKELPDIQLEDAMRLVRKAPKLLSKSQDEAALQKIAESLTKAGAEVEITHGEVEPEYVPPKQVDARNCQSISPEHARLRLIFQHNLTPNTSLLEAIRLDNPATLIKLLLATGADINTADKDGTVLHQAVISGNLEVTKLLLSYPQIDVSAVDASGMTALDYAEQYGTRKFNIFNSNKTVADREAILVLLRTAHSDNGSSFTQNLDQLNSLSESLSKDPFCDLSMYSPEWIRNAAQQALRNEYHINTDSYKASLLSAAEKGNFAMIRLLLMAGADANETTLRGKSALYLAAEHGHLSCVQLLTQQAKVDVNAVPNFSTSTPLSIASENGHVEVVTYLLTLPEIDANTASPLTKACQNSRKACVEALLASPKVDVNADSPLLTALIYNHDCANLLLAAPDINICQLGSNGTSPIHYAASNNLKDLLWSMLVMPNVDLEILDSNGNTPLFVAAQSGNSDCLYYILN
ncbi:MAG: ankyrin repeat domain-containing protein, partial [Akkermansia sp.]|nr:ankyrin repeat domain-containing protein [Akkermansia sp.]